MRIPKYSFILPVLLLVTAIYSQEGIKFEIPTDEDGLPVPISQKPDTVQKLGLVSGLPLNLSALSAKDTAGFETYSKRHTLIQDSISATHRAIEAVKRNTESFMPKLEPKGEFEKQAEYEARKSKRESELKQRIERDTKSLTQRLAELEKAKNKIQENQASLYGSVDIKSTPSAVSVWLGREEIGATPAEYNLLIPGEVKISLRKDGYNQWDTTLQVTPGAKFKLNAVLEEKSIFSQNNEIDFSKILSKDTTVLGYEARIKRANARKTEIDEEIKQILEGFKNNYPVLEPKKAGETSEDFEKRKKAWNKEGVRQYSELQKKHEAYSEKLKRTVVVLNDYIIATQSSVITEAAIFPKVELGAYDAESETFKLVVQDSTSEKSPFNFTGKVGVPVAVAKELNRSAPGFAIGVQFINYPFETGQGNINLAMSGLQASLNDKELAVQGSFSEIEKYRYMNGYDTWRRRADSLLKGTLKSQGLDYAWAMGKAAAGDVAKKEGSGEGLSGKGIFRIAMFGLAAGAAGFGIWQNIEADSKYKKAKDAYMEVYNAYGTPQYAEKLSAFDKNKNDKEMKEVDDAKTLRNISYISAGVLGTAGIVSFFF